MTSAAIPRRGDLVDYWEDDENAIPMIVVHVYEENVRSALALFQDGAFGGHRIDASLRYIRCVPAMRKDHPRRGRWTPPGASLPAEEVPCIP